jgi:hypothetical protein
VAGAPMRGLCHRPPQCRVHAPVHLQLRCILPRSDRASGSPVLPSGTPLALPMKRPSHVSCVVVEIAASRTALSVSAPRPPPYVPPPSANPCRVRVHPAWPTSRVNRGRLTVRHGGISGICAGSQSSSLSHPSLAVLTLLLFSFLSFLQLIYV